MPDDVVVQNIQRACKQAIDAACREVSRFGLGVPADSADAFSLLERERLLSPPLAERMRRMVGFRNVAVHEYRRLDPAVVRTIVEHRLGDFEDLCRERSFHRVESLRTSERSRRSSWPARSLSHSSRSG